MKKHEYLYELVRGINNYDGSPENTERLKNLICYISDNKSYSSDPIYRELLVEASMKLRMFGYYTSANANKIEINELGICGVEKLSYRAVEKLYQSEMDEGILLDGSQKNIVNAFQTVDTKRLFLSAPTSFGKTFMLREMLYLNRDRYGQVFLIFPTIALLFENTEKIRAFLLSKGLKYNIINSVYTKISPCEKNIFILTPERALQILSSFEGTIDFFFFDEIYKIDDDFFNDDVFFSPAGGEENEFSEYSLKSDRAKAFRICLYLLSKNVKEYYLAGPYINLEETSNGFKRFFEINAVYTKEIRLEPTMKIITHAWNKKCIEHHPLLGERAVQIYETRPTNSEERATGIVKHISKNKLGKTILYCSTPKKAMQYTKKVISMLSGDMHVAKQKKHTLGVCAEFADHLKHRYCTLDSGKLSWSIVDALNSGYGIHHGRLPKYVQKHMLKLFNEGEVEFLFCTSTIIEGVNTDASNVVILNNSSGKKLLTPFSIKNIKGRAGRYYNQYIGRIYFTDKTQLEIDEKPDIKLDFRTFGEKPLHNIDLDNVWIEDLMESNQPLKRVRDNKLDKKLLPDEVFIQNRLIDRLTQEKFLKHLSQPQVFSSFQKLIDNGHIWFFINGKYMEKIMISMIQADLLNEDEGKKTLYVVQKYGYEGFRGLMEYQLKNNEDVEDAFLEVFYQIRTTVEFEMPKLLRLFETLYRQAGKIKDIDVSNFSLSNVIRFYETGVESDIGNHLVEYGYPTEAIKDIEQKFPDLVNMNMVDGATYLKDKIDDIGMLDSFERGLLRDAMGELGLLWP